MLGLQREKVVFCPLVDLIVLEDHKRLFFSVQDGVKIKYSTGFLLYEKKIKKKKRF